MKNRLGATRALVGAVFPLLNVSALTSVATGGLYHGQAPQGTARPYGVLQAPAGYPGVQSMGNPGEEVKFQLRAVSDARDYAAALAVIETAKQLLDGEKPTIAGHLVLRLWWEWTQVYPDPELVNGVPVWNAVSQWCAWVDQTS